MLQRVVMLAAESLKVLECQLMDRGQIQDVKVGSKPFEQFEFTNYVQLNPPPPLSRWSCGLLWTCTTF